MSDYDLSDDFWSNEEQVLEDSRYRENEDGPLRLISDVRLPKIVIFEFLTKSRILELNCSKVSMIYYDTINGKQKDGYF